MVELMRSDLQTRLTDCMALIAEAHQIELAEAIAVAQREHLVQALEAERYSHIKTNAKTK